MLHLEVLDVRTVADADSTSLYGPDARWRFADAEDRLPTLIVSSGQWLVEPTSEGRLVSAVAATPARGIPEDFVDLPSGQLRFPGEQREIKRAAAVLARTRLEIGRDEIARLKQVRGTKLDLRIGDRWFRGRTVDEWRDLVEQEPERFVAAGGLWVLDAAGMLTDHPELRSQAAAVADHHSRDAVWLLPPGPPLGPRA